MSDEGFGNYGEQWRPVRGRCFHPTGDRGPDGGGVCCAKPAVIRGCLVTPTGLAYMVDSCSDHAHLLDEPRPLTS